MDPLTLKHHNFFPNKNNRKATDKFAPRLEIHKLESLKIQ